MTTDLDAARQFMLSSSTLLDRLRFDFLAGACSAARARTALSAYQNPDGGFGHALEPDIRGPESQPVAALHALEVLRELGIEDDPMVDQVAAWVRGTAEPDGGVPFVIDSPTPSPHAPWMTPAAGGSHLTFGLAAVLTTLGCADPWVTAGTQWCWDRIEGSDGVEGYSLKFALEFLDASPEEDRARRGIDRLRNQVGSDGTVGVPGGVDGERLTPLTLSPRPGRRSRELFSPDQIRDDLDRLQAAQQPDGGWMFDWLGWSPGQIVEWRGAVTLEAVATLAAHGRIALHPPGRHD